MYIINFNFILLYNESILILLFFILSLHFQYNFHLFSLIIHFYTSYIDNCSMLIITMDLISSFYSKDLISEFFDILIAY